MFVDELLRQVARVYGTCSRYRDRGVRTTRISTSTDHGPLEVDTRMEFRTRWRRPDALTFEYESMMQHHSTRCVLWARAGETKSWWTCAPGVQKWPDIGRALGAKAGVSGGLSILVPALLLQDPRRAGLPAAGGGFTGIPDQNLGLKCIRVGVRRGDAWKLEYWIDTERALLLRLDEARSMSAEELMKMWSSTLHTLEAESSDSDPERRSRTLVSIRDAARRSQYDMTTASTTVWEPELEPCLDEAEFEFTPPTT